MHLVTVRLDRIFDVVHFVHRGHETTLFGFQYGEKRVFGLSLPGRHVLEAGAVLTFCLRTENDWTTLVGWYNHSTGETVLESAGQVMIAIGILVVVAVVVQQSADQLSIPLVFVVLAMGMWACGCFYSIRFLRRARAALARVKLAPTPSLAFPSGVDASATGVNATGVNANKTT